MTRQSWRRYKQSSVDSQTTDKDGNSMLKDKEVIEILGRN
jgi:hypothetical protein